MSLTGHRRDEHAVFELLTSGEQSLGELTGVRAGSGQIELNANADLRAGGSFVLEDTGQEIAWGSDRVRVTWWADGVEMPLGVFLIAAPTLSHGEAGVVSRTVELIDKLTVPTEQALTQTLTVPAGTNVVDTAVQVLGWTGETRVAVTRSSAVLGTDQTWTPGTSLLRVINDLLDSAGYWSLWTDALGQFRMEPYVAPASRPIVWTFEKGAASIHSPVWDFTSDVQSVPNRVTLTTAADDDGAFLTAVATNEDPASASSFQARGRRWVDYAQEGVEAAGQVALQAVAERTLVELSTPAAMFEQVKHALVPGIWYNSAVRFVSHDVDARATVTKMTVPLAVGEDATAQWRMS